MTAAHLRRISLVGVRRFLSLHTKRKGRRGYEAESPVLHSVLPTICERRALRCAMNFSLISSAKL